MSRDIFFEQKFNESKYLFHSKGGMESEILSQQKRAQK